MYALSWYFTTLNNSLLLSIIILLHRHRCTFSLSEWYPLLISRQHVVQIRLLRVHLELHRCLLERETIFYGLGLGRILHLHEFELLHVMLVVHVLLGQLLVGRDLGLLDPVTQHELVLQLLNSVEMRFHFGVFGTLIH